MGCDDELTYDFTEMAISIHAPAWGATNVIYKFSFLGLVSIRRSFA